MVEKRKFTRYSCRFPVRLRSCSLPAQVFEGWCKDISVGGIQVELPRSSSSFYDGLTSDLFDIDIIVNDDSVMNLRGQFRWNSISQDNVQSTVVIVGGIEFAEEFLQLQEELKPIFDRLRPKPPKLDLPTYTLLIDGKDFDTGVYEYFPYADKMVAEPKNTLRVIRMLREGKIPGNYKEYIAARYCVGNHNVNKMAIESTYKASKEFARLPLEVRKKIILDIHDLLLEYKEEFINLLIQEGHPRKVAEWEFSGMEIGCRKPTVEFYYSQIRRSFTNNDELIYVIRKPDGVVGLCPPRNAAASNSLLGILVFLVGNVIIVKPPMLIPISTIFLWKKIIWPALQKNDAPPGCLNIVLGNSKEIVDEWIFSSQVKTILYFGESERGLEIGKKAYTNGKKVILELSGSDMLLVWKDADIEKASSALVEGFLGSTQICMVPKKALIHYEVFEEFITKFVKKVKNLKFGLPSDPETILSPVVRMREFFQHMEDAVKKGGKVLCGGVRVNHKDTPSSHGAYIRPTVIKVDSLNKAKQMLCFQLENFFPLIPVVKIEVSSDEEVFEKMVSAVNENLFGLRCSVWVKDKIYMDKFINEINNAGIIRINSSHIEFSPYISTHGGTKNSGGPYGEMNYIWLRTSHLQGVSIKKRN